MDALVRPARLRYAAVVSVWACCAVASPGCSAPVPGTTTPGGNPVIESAGHTPTLPLTTLGPVLVTLGVAPSTAKLEAVPRSWAAAGALVMRSRATAIGRTASGKRVMVFLCLRIECAKLNCRGCLRPGPFGIEHCSRLRAVEHRCGHACALSWGLGENSRGFGHGRERGLHRQDEGAAEAVGCGPRRPRGEDRSGERGGESRLARADRGAARPARRGAEVVPADARGGRSGRRAAEDGDGRRVEDDPQGPAESDLEPRRMMNLRSSGNAVRNAQLAGNLCVDSIELCASHARHVALHGNLIPHAFMGDVLARAQACILAGAAKPGQARAELERILATLESALE